MQIECLNTRISTAFVAGWLHFIRHEFHSTRVDILSSFFFSFKRNRRSHCMNTTCEIQLQQWRVGYSLSSKKSLNVTYFLKLISGKCVNTADSIIASHFHVSLDFCARESLKCSQWEYITPTAHQKVFMATFSFTYSNCCSQLCLN